MEIEIHEQEREFLLQILEDRLGTLRQEIHHTIRSDYAEMLKDREKLLKGTIEKLKPAADE